MREDYETANEILPSVPVHMRYKVAQFLQARGLLEMALEVTTEDDHRFDLSVQLRRLHLALTITRKVPLSTAGSKSVTWPWNKRSLMWRRRRSLQRATSMASCCSTCTNNLPALNALGELAASKGKTNVAFTCFHVNGRHVDCVELLIATKKCGAASCSHLLPREGR